MHDLEPGADPEVLHALKVADGMAADSKLYWCKRRGGLIMEDVTILHKRTVKGSIYPPYWISP